MDRRDSVESTREAWRKYVSTGALSRAALRDPVFRAWERCHDLRTSPTQAQAESLSPDATERLLGARDDVLRAARPYMAALSRAAGSERHAAMLGDQSGVVLDIVGDEQTVHGPEPFPGPGALLAEEVSGANGIGTPLAGAEYVELVGPEHFIGGFHIFTCQGVPFRTPDGSVAGVISTSVRKVEASARLREILICAARGIEAELLRTQLEEDVRRVLTSPTGSALTRLRDDILQSYASARVRLEAASRRAPSRGPEATLALIRDAQRAIDRFARRTALWRELASAEVGVAQPVAAHVIVRDVIDLLETEARTRLVDLHAPAFDEVVFRADPRTFAREVFTALLDALDAAGSGGAVQVIVREGSSAEPPLLRVRAHPAAAHEPFERSIHLVAGSA
jgi:transcriptional regulator of acetoin/glycerol metabolism